MRKLSAALFPIVLLLFILLSFSSLVAAPSIDNVFVFTDNRPSNDIFGNPGWNYSLQAIISDPLGVPNNISSVRAVGLSNGDSRTLRFSPVGSTNFYVTFPDYQGQTGQYNFTVTNKQGQMDSQLSHILDKPTALPIPQNLKVSEFGLTPTLTFDPVAGANRYSLEIIDNNLKQLFISPDSTIPSLKVPIGQLQYNTTYFLSARAEQFDFSEPFTGVSRLENRSLNYFGFRAFPAVTATPNILAFPNTLLGNIGNFIFSQTVNFETSVANQLIAGYQGVEAMFTGDALATKTKFEGASQALNLASTLVGILSKVTDPNTVAADAAIIVSLTTSYVLGQISQTVKDSVTTAKKFFDGLVGVLKMTPTTFWTPVLNSLSFLAKALSLGFHNVALDPPDANFTQVVQPDAVKISSLSAPEISSDRLAFATSIFNAYAETAEYLDLSRISMERYLAALAATDSVSASQQLLAFLDYLNTYNADAILASSLTNELIQRMIADGVPDSKYDPQLLVDFQQQIRTFGLPSDVAGFLIGLGLNESDLPNITNAVLNFNPNSIGGSLYATETNIASTLLVNTTAAAVPEPNSLILMGTGLILLYLVMRRKQVINSRIRTLNPGLL